MHSFDVIIGEESFTIHQNAVTGLFYATWEHEHAPVDYDLIKDETTIGQRIKYWRCQYGYTQTALAHLIGVSDKNVIAMWENGRRTPRERYVQKLAYYLDYDSFTTETDKK